MFDWVLNTPLVVHWLLNHASAGGSYKIYFCSSPRLSLRLLSRLTHYVFLVFRMKLEFNKLFSRKFLLCSYLDIMGHIWVQCLKFSLNLLIRFFWNCAWWKEWKSRQELSFANFNENFQYAQKNHFSLNLFIKFFWNYTWWEALKSG